MDLTRISYPCYIAPKIEGEEKIFINDIDNIKGYMLKGIQSSDRLYLYDGMTIEEWEAKTCNLVYEDRLGLVRHCINQLADYKNIIDLPLDTCYNPGDVIKYKNIHLEQGYAGSIVKSKYEKYRF